MSRTTIPFLTLISTLIVSCVHAEKRSDSLIPKSSPTPPVFMGWDIYGTDRINTIDLSQTFGSSLQICLDLYLKQQFEGYDSCRTQVSQGIKTTFHFASVDLSLIRYYPSPLSSPVYGTIDVVEKDDVKFRMPFAPKPSAHFSDPDGLLKAWGDYLEAGSDLLSRHEISGLREECPAFHCIFGHKHPKLAPYERIFVEGVAKHENELRDIFLNDANDQHRANAAFLLAYTHDGTALVSLLSKRLTDESREVRNNIMRVFINISYRHPEITIPLESVISALDFPNTTDRNKASAVVLFKVSNPSEREKYRDTVMKRAVPHLLRMLRLNQPNNHDMAYSTLKILSGSDFGERN